MPIYHELLEYVSEGTEPRKSCCQDQERAESNALKPTELSEFCLCERKVDALYIKQYVHLFRAKGVPKKG